MVALLQRLCYRFYRHRVVGLHLYLPLAFRRYDSDDAGCCDQLLATIARLPGDVKRGIDQIFSVAVEERVRLRMNRDTIRVIAARSAIACSTRARATTRLSCWSAVIATSPQPPVLDDYSANAGPLTIRASGHRIGNSQEVLIPVRTHCRTSLHEPWQRVRASSPSRPAQPSTLGQSRTCPESPGEADRRKGS